MLEKGVVMFDLTLLLIEATNIFGIFKFKEILFLLFVDYKNKPEMLKKFK